MSHEIGFLSSPKTPREQVAEWHYFYRVYKQEEKEVKKERIDRQKF